MEKSPDIWLFIESSIKLLALMTPPAVLTAFLTGTQHFDAARKRSIALRCGFSVLIAGLLLYFFGTNIFDLFGFTLDAFRIGAGSLLFLSAVTLMKDAPSDNNPTHEDPSRDISVVPLAIPLCLGPASIGTLMIVGATANSLEKRLIGAAALVLAAACITGMLLIAGTLARLLGRTGIAVMAKLTGLILAAMSAQVVFSGIKGFLQL